MSVGEFKKKDYLANIDNKYKNIFKMNETNDEESLQVIGLKEVVASTPRDQFDTVGDDISRSS